MTTIISVLIFSIAYVIGKVVAGRKMSDAVMSMHDKVDEIREQKLEVIKSVATQLNEINLTLKQIETDKEAIANFIDYSNELKLKEHTIESWDKGKWINELKRYNDNERV